MERVKNLYYQGKLLQSNDFILEQQYVLHDFNAMRLYAFGTGVLEGFEIRKKGSSKFQLDKGIAIDGLGRVLYNQQNEIFDIRELSGFNELDNQGFVILTYNEKKLAVDENVQANHMQETYQLSICNQFNLIDTLQDFFRIKQLYCDDQILIQIQMPAYFGDEGKIQFRIKIMNKSMVSVQCSANFHCNHFQLEQSEINFNCQNNHVCDEAFYIMRKEQTHGRVAIADFTNVRIFIGNKEIEVDDVQYRINMHHNLKEVLTSHMYQIKHDKRDSLCLGTISFHKEKDVVIIDDIDATPSAYAYRPPLFHHLDKLLYLYGYDSNPIKIKQTTKEDVKASGIHRILVNEDQVLYISDEMEHGLGLGNIQMHVAVYNFHDASCCFGKSSLFREQEEVELAVQIMKETGTFQIACKLPTYHTQEYIDVIWYATLFPSLEQSSDMPKLLRIEPCAIELSTFSTCSFTPIFLNVSDIHDVHFKVVDENGGSIDEEGNYYASGNEGIFQIQAMCKEDVVYAYVKVVNVHE